MAPYDLCLQDDSNGNLLQINSTTGAYQFTNCVGLSIGGTGLVSRRGGLITLQHNASNRRVMGKVDLSTGKGTGSVQQLSGGMLFTITDRSIANSNCGCR